MTNVSIKNKLLILFSLCSIVTIGQTSKTLDFKIDTLNFDSYSMDINNDLKNDIVCFSKPDKGDSLFVYLSNNGDYECSLKTLGFTQEGLYFIENVSVLTENKMPTMRIQTRFNGSGGQKLIYFIAYSSRKKQWKLIRTEESGTICRTENDCCEYLHLLTQRLILNEKVNWNHLRHGKKHGRDFCK